LPILRKSINTHHFINLKEVQMDSLPPHKFVQPPSCFVITDRRKLNITWLWFKIARGAHTHTHSWCLIRILFLLQKVSALRVT